MSSYHFIDCDFTTGECPVCGAKAKPGTHRNCYAIGPATGSELRKIIKEIGIHVDCVKCAEWSSTMNRWGPAKCKEHRADIVQRLKDSAGEAGIKVVMKAAAHLVLKPWFSILDPFGSMVDEAIRRAEAKSNEP